MKTALIAGATGLVGSELLQKLISEPTYKKIHILVRKQIKVHSDKVIQHEIDFEHLNDFKMNDHIDHVFCTLGTTIKIAGTKENFRKVDYDYVLELGKKAKEWNAEKFLMVTALGANAKSGIFYNRVKGEIEVAIQNLNLSHLFIFRPSLLMGNRKEHRAGEKSAIVVYKVINPLFFGKLKKYKGIQASRVAQAMLLTALHSKDTIKILESDKIQVF